MVKQTCPGCEWTQWNKEPVQFCTQCGTKLPPFRRGRASHISAKPQPSKRARDKSREQNQGGQGKSTGKSNNAKKSQTIPAVVHAALVSATVTAKEQDTAQEKETPGDDEEIQKVASQITHLEVVFPKEHPEIVSRRRQLDELREAKVWQLQTQR